MFSEIRDIVNTRAGEGSILWERIVPEIYSLYTTSIFAYRSFFYKYFASNTTKIPTSLLLSAIYRLLAFHVKAFDVNVTFKEKVFFEAL